MNREKLDRFLLEFMEKMIISHTTNEFERDQLRGCQSTIRVLCQDENNLRCLNLNPLLDKFKHEFSDLELSDYYDNDERIT